MTALRSVWKCVQRGTWSLRILAASTTAGETRTEKITACITHNALPLSPPRSHVNHYPHFSPISSTYKYIWTPHWFFFFFFFSRCCNYFLQWPWVGVSMCQIFFLPYCLWFKARQEVGLLSGFFDFFFRCRLSVHTSVYCNNAPKAFIVPWMATYNNCLGS